MLEEIPHDLTSQYFFKFKPISVGNGHYMDLLSHRAGFTRRLFRGDINLAFRSVNILKFWDVGRVPILGLYQTKSIQNTSSWSHYTQCLEFSVVSGAWVWPNQCTPIFRLSGVIGGFFAIFQIFDVSRVEAVISSPDFQIAWCKQSFCTKKQNCIKKDVQASL